jgi:hypothetical protein
VVNGRSSRYSSLTKPPGAIVAALGLLLVFKRRTVSSVTDGVLSVHLSLGSKDRLIEVDELFMQNSQRLARLPEVSVADGVVKTAVTSCARTDATFVRSRTETSNCDRRAMDM